MFSVTFLYCMVYDTLEDGSMQGHSAYMSSTHI